MKREIELKWFELLHKSQLEDLKVFMKPKYFNVFNGVIDKYSDSAHFIYELLQNADDAGATQVEIELEKDKFIFTHNGTVKFTISNPDNEVTDREAGRLGHINSICSIGFSSKNYESEIKENKIGKFGVGFKAVFQYTSTPEIYDDNFCFRIDNYIVPTLIESNNYKQRRKTVFVLPFNHKDISPHKAYEEISQKLTNLGFPQLFLHNIRTIYWKTRENSDYIEKSLDFEESNNDITYSLYNLKKKDDKKRILMLCREVKVPKHGTHEISIGYYIYRGHIDTKTTRNISCFFPTNENIGTCYEIHAPFALVDNRQQIKRNDEINQSLFEAIAHLAADSLVILRDWKGFDKAKLLNDNILNLIKYNTESYDDGCYWGNKIEDFFIQSYSNIFENEPLFLSRSGDYLLRNNIWWSPNEIRKIFDDKQLSLLTELSIHGSDIDEEYDEENIEKDIYGFGLCTVSKRDIDDAEISIDILDGEELAKHITSAFMQEQSIDWLNRFYEFVLKERLLEYYELNKGNKTNAPMRRAQIIKNEAGEFVRAFDDEDRLNIFFYQQGVSTENESINTELYNASEEFREVIKTLNIKAPSPLDAIRIQINNIESKDSNSKSDINDFFINVIKYYNCCSRDEQKQLLELLSNSNVFLCDRNDNSGKLYLENPVNIFKDIPSLREYFRVYSLNHSVKKYFLNTDSFDRCIESVGQDNFSDFINALIHKDSPDRITEKLNLTSEEIRSRACYKVYDKEFSSYEGLISVIRNIENGHGNKELSLFIWDLLIKAYNDDSNFFRNNVSNYFYYYSRVQNWSYNSLILELQNRHWLYVDDTLKSIKEDAYKEDILDSGYTYHPELLKLLEVLSTPNIREVEQINEMSEDTREIFALGQELRSRGISNIDELDKKLERLFQLEQKEEQEAFAQKERKEKARERKKLEELERESKTHVKSEKLKSSDFEAPDNINSKQNRTNSTRNQKQSIDDILKGFEEKVNIQKEEFERVANIREHIGSSEKYSYDWFLSLMELEVQAQGVIGASGKKSLYIRFDTAIPKDHSLIILSDPSRYIPSSIEDIDSLPVSFVLKNGLTEKYVFESASVKNDSLILKCGKNGAKIIELISQKSNQLQFAFIEVNEPIEILKYWLSELKSMKLNPAFSLKENLRKNIEFIFGPPGTGKTTTLANKINSIIYQANSECRILVLAPTNKACDVLTRKLYEQCDGSDDWIWRFVKTDDQEIEAKELVYGRESRISYQKKVCVISTMARYSFDGFTDGDLKSLEWDFIFIDEASMIPLYEVILPIYNSRVKNVIISGDPFQIEPIVNIDIWKDENIYTMVNLNDFVNPSTEPYQFKVTPLMTQYRSIPSIGELFSRYLYGNKLLHSRSVDDHKKIKMGFTSSPLNIISFPVNNDSIFDVKRLVRSNIQIYSVIFVVELLKYMTNKISQNHPNEKIRIGVISPYSAEIKSIQKIFNQSMLLSSDVEVICGSAHGFQGDQCEIVIAVLNPPASGLKRAADLTFVNNQNILNVAISRASDYLFLVIPEKNYENFNSLYEIKKIGRIMTSIGCCINTSQDIEKIMFGESHYIENNTYVTSHKMANVFNNPLTKYEIRIDENAIDIQINDSLE